jgi:plastocyanin
MTTQHPVPHDFRPDFVPDYGDPDKKKKHGHCDFEITPIDCRLWGSIKSSVYEKDYPQGEHDSKTIIACDEEWYVKIEWDLWGGFLHHLCGYFCVCVFLESIGPGDDYKICCKEWIPMDPCGTGHYEVICKIDPCSVNCGDCGQLYEVGVTLTSFDSCKKPGHIAAYCKGPTLMFYERGDGCTNPPPPPPPPPPVVDFRVSILDNRFDPPTITIPAGRTITWTNNGVAPHTVTSNPGTLGCNPPSTESFSSGTLNTNQPFPHTFNTPGTFAYHCEIHGCSMAGTVTVT